MIYSQSGILYEIIPEAPRPSHEAEKPKPGPHADGVVGSINSPTVESLTKQLHQLSVKHSTAEAAKAAPSPQSANVFAQTSSKGNQQPDGKKKKGKKGEGNQNQNKPKPANNADGGKKEKKKVKFPCKLCHEDHLTHLCPLMEQAQKLLKVQQPTVLKDPFPQGQKSSSVSNIVGGTSSAPPDQNYINMVQSETLL